MDRDWTYDTANQLAESLVKCMETAPEPMLSVFCDVRVGPQAEILFLTHKFREEQQATGMLLCPACGSFFGGERGLRTHQQIKHNSSYEVAKVVTSTVKQQLIIRQQPLSFPTEHVKLEEAARRRTPGVSKTVLSPAFEAARDGKLAELREMVESGWNPLEEDRHGSNALLWAAGGGSLSTCKYLVDDCHVPLLPVDTQASKSTVKRRRNALHWAARHGHLPVCKWLVEKGVPVDSATYDGTVALHWAVWQGHLDVCKWLVYRAGCKLNHCNSFGCNAIQWAAQTGNIDMCRWLAAAGLDITIVNNNGHSAIHKAAAKGQSAVCAWLLNEECLGLGCMQADGEGNSPEALARLEGFRVLAESLETARSALEAVDKPVGPGGPFPIGGGEEVVLQRKGGRSSCRVSCTREARLRQQGVVDVSDDIHDSCSPLRGNANRQPKAQHSLRGGGELVSIVLPVYNGAAFLDDCLQGIIMQSHRPLELVACDNGSTDATSGILSEWRPRFLAAGIQFVCIRTGPLEPRGCGYGRNRCIEASSGAWICSADADDLMLPDRVRLQLAAAVAAPRNTLLGSRFVREPHTATWHYALWANSITQRDLYLQRFRECTVVQPTWFYHRRVWEAAGPFVVKGQRTGDESELGDDLRFFLKHLSLGGSVRRLDCVLVVYRHHGGQLSHCTPSSLLMRIRASAFEASVLSHWSAFTVWGTGRDAKAFVACLKDSREKIAAFAEIDAKKVGTVFHSTALSVSAPIIHWRDVRPPVVVCVARGRTGGVLEQNVESIGLEEGVDCWFVV